MTQRPPARPTLREPYPTELKPYKPGLAERLYLPLISGLMVTLRHFVRNLLGRGKRYTIEYPEKRRDYSHRFRGHHIRPVGPIFIFDQQRER